MFVAVNRLFLHQGRPSYGLKSPGSVTFDQFMRLYVRFVYGYGAATLAVGRRNISVADSRLCLFGRVPVQLDLRFRRYQRSYVARA